MRYKFVQDQDCHWYMIPSKLHPLFVQLEENGEADWYTAFDSKFDEYRIDSPSNYTFERPE